VILSSKEFRKETATPENIEEKKKEAGQSISQRLEHGPIEENDLPKTIIVSSDAVFEKAGGKGVEAGDTTENDVPETVIFSLGKVKDIPADAERTRSGAEGVLDGPTQDASAEKKGNGPDAGPVETEEDTDALPETMIFKRDKIDKEQ